MATQALYRRWRSQSFDEVIGQEHVTVTLRNALREGRMTHAYLFAGPRGTGKTSTARILAKAINCLDEDVGARPCNRCRICTAISEGRQLDLIEIDAASNRGIDEIRDLREKIGFRPNEARFKVYIIDEVHMLTKEAFNALLKTLEEPPSHAVFVLATTEPDRVPETVRSRCQRFDFRRIPTAEIIERLTAILKAEEHQAAPEALAAIARRATGSMRDAVSLLDQLLSYDDPVLTLERVEGVLGLVNAQAVGQLVGCLAGRDAAGGLALINSLVSDGVELSQLVDQIVTYLRGVLFLRVARAPELLDLPQDIIAVMAGQAESLTAPVLLAAVRSFTEARAALRDQVPGVPQLPLEVAFLRAAGVIEAAPSAAAPSQAAPQPREAGPAAAAQPAAAVRPAAPPREQTRLATPAGMPAAGAPAGEGSRVPAGAASAAEPSDDLLKRAQAGWDQFLAMAGKRCGMKVQAALRSVRELDVAGQTVVMHFAHAFSRDLVSEGENRVRVEAAWQELLGEKIVVRCVLAGESVASPPAPPPADAKSDPDEILLEEARRHGAIVTSLDKP